VPVLVTGPGTAVGRRLVERLVATGGQVRAYCSGDDPVAELRQAGVVCAIGDLDDEGRLESAMEQVHTVIHLALDEGATVVRASVGAEVQRVLVLSLPGAGEHAEPQRAALGEIELQVASAPFSSVVVRAGVIDTPELRQALARTPLSRDALARDVAPVAADDLAAAFVWLDDRRDLAAGHEVLGADATSAEPLGDWLRRVGVTPLGFVGRTIARDGAGGGRLAALLGGPLVSTGLPSVWDVSGIRPRD
jgi:uncharacterized protein YbjT (DUF2867 family)